MKSYITLTLLVQAKFKKNFRGNLSKGQFGIYHKFKSLSYYYGINLLYFLSIKQPILDDKLRNK